MRGRSSRRPRALGRGREAPKGGTLRLSRLADVDSVDPALAYYAVVVGDRVRDLREAVQLPGRAGRGGDAARPGGRRPVHGLEGRTHLHLRAEADVPLPHRRARSPRRASRTRSTATPSRSSSRRRSAYMREIVGAAAVIDGKATVDLRRPRARPLPPPDPADQPRRRLHRPADDAVLLPDPAATRRSTRAESTIRPARARTTSPSGSSTSGSCSSATRTTAAAARRTSTRSSGRSARAGRTAWLAVEQDRIDYCARSASIRAALPDAGREVRRQPARRTVLRQPHASTTWFFAFNHDRPAFDGPRPDPAQEGDQLRDRPPGAGPRVRLPGRQAHRPDAPARARAPREHLPARRRRHVAAARRWLAQATAQAGRSSSSTRTAARSGVVDRPRRSPSTSSRSASTSR